MSAVCPQNGRKPKGNGRGLTDLCGGRFAIVPADLCEEADLSDGAFRLFAVMCGRADPRGAAKEFCLRAYASMRKISVRTVQRWRVELEEAGYIEQLSADDKSKATFQVNRDPADRRKARLGNAAAIVKRKKLKDSSGSKRQRNLPLGATSETHPRCDTHVALLQEDLQDPPYPPGEHPSGGGTATNSARQADRARRTVPAPMVRPMQGRTGSTDPTNADADLLAQRLGCSRQEAWTAILQASPGELDELKAAIRRWRAVA